MICAMNPTILENKSAADPTPSAANPSLNEIETAILAPEARAFLLKLAGRFEPRRQELLARRRTVQRRRFRKTWWIAAWKLPGRSIAR
jgi:malate synthase